MKNNWGACKSPLGDQLGVQPGILFRNSHLQKYRIPVPGIKMLCFPGFKIYFYLILNWGGTQGPITLAHHTLYDQNLHTLKQLQVGF